jgi:hypothetical protein
MQMTITRHNYYTIKINHWDLLSAIEFIMEVNPKLQLDVIQLHHFALCIKKSKTNDIKDY